MKKTIIVGFSYHSGNILSWTIRILMGVNFSHIYWKLTNEETSNETVIQASGLEVNETYYPTFLKKAIVVREFKIEVDQDRYVAVKKYLETKLGQPYAVMELFGFLYIILAKKIGIKIKKNPIDAPGYVCSGIVAAVFCDIFKLETGDVASVTPLDMAQILVDNNLIEKFWR